MKATFAGGCYWCTDAVFGRVLGVTGTVSGFTGGSLPSPTYHQVMQGRSGHIEAVQIDFDAQVVTFRSLLEIFFATHDPTSFDRQGYDAGPMYRSAIFYHSIEQKNEADEMIQNLNSSSKYSSSIVTEVRSASTFYPVGPDQQQFYDKNTEARYCKIIIDPKLDVLKKEFPKLSV